MGIPAIALACGVTKQFIHKMRRQWQETGALPRAAREYAAAIEAACGGAVRADELVTDVIWRRNADGQITHYEVAITDVAATKRDTDAKVA